MFFTYVGRELRRRRRQAVVVALGLALGIGLVVTVSAMTAGVRVAQNKVLHSLYGVGTDITVTQAAKFGTGGPARFGINPQNQSQQGQQFSRDRITQTPGLGTLSSRQVSTLSGLPHVSGVSGGLSLVSIHIQGKFTRFPTGGFGQGFGSSPTPRPSVPPIKVTTYSVDGVDVASPAVGALTRSEIASGRYFSPRESSAKVAILDRSYAKQQKLSVGSSIPIGGTTYAVIGIATAPTGGETFNVYLPLARAQALAGAGGKVNRIYVKATSSTQIAAVKSEIEGVVPKATVTDAADLASQVSGSLSSASSLSGHLGTWLSVAVLIAAFALASLLTLAAVSRRIREFGTLKALGWRSRRVVGQVMGEAVVQGILGGILGIGLGVAGTFLVAKFSPSLQATVGPAATGSGGFARPGGFAGPGSGGGFGRTFAGAAHTVTVPLTAPLNARLLALAIGLALIGGVLAGSLGGWRAARLRPAEALRRVE